jgi:hypothetical protein
MLVTPYLISMTTPEFERANDIVVSGLSGEFNLFIRARRARLAGDCCFGRSSHAGEESATSGRRVRHPRYRYGC